MSRLSLVIAILVLDTCRGPSGRGAEDVSRAPLKLHFEPHFILEAVARRMNVTLRSNIPISEIRFERTTSLRRFQTAIAAQWGYRFKSGHVASVRVTVDGVSAAPNYPCARVVAGLQHQEPH